MEVMRQILSPRKLNCRIGYSFSLSAFLLLLYSFAFAVKQEVVISGKTDDFSNCEVSLVLYDDYLTFTPKAEYKTHIDSNGAFHFSLNIEAPTDAYLRVKGMERGLYLSPEEEYTIELYLLNRELVLEFIGLDSNDINFTITQFDTAYYQVFSKYVSGFKIKDIAGVDSAVKYLESVYFTRGVFVQTYCRYKLANLEQISHRKRMGLFQAKYLHNSPVMPGHPGYFQFIDQFFADYLRLFCVQPNGAQVPDKINSSFDLNEIKELLSKDPLLQSDTLCELILTKGLMEVYHLPEFDKEAIINALNRISKSTEYPFHKKLCSNIISYLTKLTPGTNAPSFELLDVQGRLVKLPDFKGKFVYLDFWATWSTPCLKEMKVIPELVKKFGKEIEFVSISIDEDYDTMVNFLNGKDREESGVYLHFGRDKKVKGNYNIRSVPTYVIIDREGKIIDSFAKRPSGGIEQTFSKLLQEKQVGPGLLGP